MPDNQLTITPKTPMDLMQIAIEREGSIDVIERLAKLQQDFMDRGDRVAFAEAMSAFKDEMPVIVRSRSISNKDGSEKYKAVALEDVADPVMKALLKHGITYRYITDMLPNGNVKVTCLLRVRGTAYEETGATLAAAPDTSGGKDSLKAVGSTTSYLEKYTLMASCGIHVYGTDPEAVAIEGISQDEGAAWIDKIKAAATSEATMHEWTGAVNAAKKFTPPDYKAMTLFTEARDERLKSLRKAK